MSLLVRLILVVALVNACVHINDASLTANEIDSLIKTSKTQYVRELSAEMAIFSQVAFGLGLPLRKYLNNRQQVKGKTILDLGAGSGILSLIALKNGAERAVATEINPYAVANANYNAEQSGYKDRMDVRLVSMDNPGAYSVIADNEKFDLIVSNPPQGRDAPKNIYEYSHSDPELAFFLSMLTGLEKHLTENGKGVFALYYRTLTIAQQMTSELKLVVTVLLETENRNGLYYLVEVKRQQ